MANNFQYRCILFGLCLTVIGPQIADGFNENAHGILSRRAVNPGLPNASQLDSFLKNELPFEFPQGVNQPLSGANTVMQLIADGAVREDRPAQRVMNHFHDPTRTWNVAGLGRVNVYGLVHQER